MRGKKCPLCGKSIMMSERKSTTQVPYGSVEEYSFNIKECDFCGFSEYCSDHDRNFLIAEDKSEREAYKKIKEKLKEYKITIIEVERILGLGINTLEKKILKKKSPDRYSIAILRIVLEYPHILRIADNVGSFMRGKCGQETIVSEEKL